MKPPKVRQLQELNSHLREGAWSNYQSLMRRLFSAYDHYDFVRVLSGYFRNKDYTQAVVFADSLSDQQYSDATSHYVASQFTNLIKKYPFPKGKTSFKPKEKALSKFLSAEHRCKWVNRRFHLRYVKNAPFVQKERYWRMKVFISKVLGEKPDISSILDKCDFGPGASIGVHGEATNLARKFLCQSWTVTPSALVHGFNAVWRNAQAQELLLSCDSRAPFYSVDGTVALRSYYSKVRVVKNNKISFVPKTVITDRTIAVEPLLNSFIQKGIDREMRLRIKRLGIDLGDQERNQLMARWGSEDDGSEDGFVTLDLSSASDSVSIGLVRTLLPAEWFWFLDQNRSKEYEHNGRRETYHKFCSMGNGFCFPLETLLFIACCHACGCGVPGRDFRVYGDDIVVRKKYAEDVISLLKDMGFSTNKRKTFLKGPFRESCGADWFAGEDVRPYILDHALDSVDSVYKFLNLSRRNSRTTGFFDCVRPFVLGLIPKHFQLWRPHKGNADTGIDSTGDEHLTSPYVRWDKNLQTWKWYEYSRSAVPDTEIADLAGSSPAVMMYAVLRGSTPKDPFTFRRKSRTRVCLTAHSGATCTLVPT